MTLNHAKPKLWHHLKCHFIKAVGNNIQLSISISFGAKACTSLQQYHLEIITIISLAMDSSRQTVNRDILVIACQSFSVNDCALSQKRTVII